MPKMGVDDQLFISIKAFKCFCKDFELTSELLRSHKN